MKIRRQNISDLLELGGAIPTAFCVLHKMHGQDQRSEQMADSEEAAVKFAEAIVDLFGDKLELVMVCKVTPVALALWAAD